MTQSRLGACDAKFANDPARTFIESTLGCKTSQGQPMAEPDWAYSAT
jgi:hypothetical protein